MNLNKKLKNLIPKKYLDKCKVELEYIKRQKLEDYFLTIKKKGVLVKNTCNSLVAWCIGITKEKPKGTLNLIPDYTSLPD